MIFTNIAVEHILALVSEAHQVCLGYHTCAATISQSSNQYFAPFNLRDQKRSATAVNAPVYVIVTAAIRSA
jgi:hypothetical protein